MRFGLISLFNGISTFVSYNKHRLSPLLVKQQERMNYSIYHPIRCISFIINQSKWYPNISYTAPTKYTGCCGMEEKQDWLVGFYSISTFNAKSIYMQIVPFQTIQFNMSTQFNSQKHFYYKLFSLAKQS